MQETSQYKAHAKITKFILKSSVTPPCFAINHVVQLLQTTKLIGSILYTQIKSVFNEKFRSVDGSSHIFAHCKRVIAGIGFCCKNGIPCRGNFFQVSHAHRRGIDLCIIRACVDSTLNLDGGQKVVNGISKGSFFTTQKDSLPCCKML
jgi:hypothetical protein